MARANRRVSDDKSKESPSRRSAERWSEAKFVQYELDKEQQKECKAYELSGDSLLDAVLEEISNGYQFTLKWDDYNESYAVFMLIREEGHPNQGLILTGRGSTIGKALKQTLYKHRVCLDTEWGGYAERRGRDVLDD